MYNIKSIQIVPSNHGEEQIVLQVKSGLKTETWELNLKLTSWQAHDLVLDTELWKSDKQGKRRRGSAAGARETERQEGEGELGTRSWTKRRYQHNEEHDTEQEQPRQAGHLGSYSLLGEECIK